MPSRGIRHVGTAGGAEGTPMQELRLVAVSEDGSYAVLTAPRLSDLGADMEDAQWDSRKRADGSWQVSLVFTAGGIPRLAEWVFDPRSRHVSPADDTAAGLCLPDVGLPPMAPRQPSATVTPIG